MLIVKKKSGKPFKSGLITATVKATVINEQDPECRLAYTFIEDDSCVNIAQCVSVEENGGDKQKWAAGDNDNWFTSELLDSREAAIQYVKDEFEGTGYIGRAEELTIQQLVGGAFHISDLVERIEEYAHEEIGEAADDLLDFDPEKLKLLEKTICDMLAANFSMPGIKYKVTNPIEAVSF